MNYQDYNIYMPYGDSIYVYTKDMNDCYKLKAKFRGGVNFNGKGMIY